MSDEYQSHLLSLATATEEELIAIRRFLHTIPELSMEERETAGTVKDMLMTCTPDELHTGVGGTGILASWNGKEPGPTLMFRCELDALPIQEINTFEHRSPKEGVSHKCGHDGHMAIMLATAQRFSKEPPEKGKVVLMFQPGEEDGRGAKAVYEDPVFASVKPDMVFALHNLPGYPLGEVVMRRNSFNSSVTSLVIQLKGTTSHAAEPELGKNPAAAIGQILTHLDALHNNDTSRDDFTLITPVYITMGEIAYGVSAGYGEIHLTLRTWTEDKLQTLCADVLNMVTEVCHDHDVPFDSYYTHHFQANENHDSAVDLIEQAANELGIANQYRPYPFKWGEDFGLFTQHFPGALFGLGSGTDCPALHNPDYDFPDELIKPGADLFQTIYRLATR